MQCLASPKEGDRSRQGDCEVGRGSWQAGKNLGCFKHVENAYCRRLQPRWPAAHLVLSLALCCGIMVSYAAIAAVRWRERASSPSLLLTAIPIFAVKAALVRGAGRVVHAGAAIRCPASTPRDLGAGESAESAGTASGWRLSQAGQSVVLSLLLRRLCPASVVYRAESRSKIAKGEKGGESDRRDADQDG